jgi:hypothetical protein
MSLKAFHVLFVTISVLITLGFGIWSLQQYGATGSSGSLALGIASFVVSVALVVYGVAFLKKLKNAGI